MKNSSKLATTVKIDKELYNEFKMVSYQTNHTLQKMLEKCVYLYVKDEDFRNKVSNFFIPVLSGSELENEL